MPESSNLGAHWDGRATTFCVWAPDHREVAVVLDDGQTRTLTQSATGYWSATFADVVNLAAEAVTFESSLGATPARLVLVDAMELAWQRATYRGHQHRLLPADPGLVGRNTLQHWLWQRLQTPGNQVAA